MPGRRWTARQRHAQSAAIRRWKPWNESTGPRTEKGKARSSKNGLKHGVRSQVMAEFRKLDKKYRAEPWNLVLCEEVEVARERAMRYVVEAVDQNDLVALTRAFTFTSIQTNKAVKRFLKLTKGSP